ncbi:hypothetical protein [Streptomyces sp. NPDC049881]
MSAFGTSVTRGTRACARTAAVSPCLIERPRARRPALVHEVLPGS